MFSYKIAKVVAGYCLKVVGVVQASLTPVPDMSEGIPTVVGRDIRRVSEIQGRRLAKTLHAI